MNKILKLKNCSGCYACANICPKGCITMKTDKEGFWYPCIDKENCINCGLCERICPVLKEYKGNPKGKAYACINKNEEIRRQSSSGGVFTLIAENVISKGGVVFGAAFDEEFQVEHIAVEQTKDLEKLRGSKYLQSRIGDAYKQAKSFLESGRLVLFSGTPCQISGLKAYLGKEYDNLIMQDIICHGVPSPKVWKKYVDFREANAESRSKKIDFRNKGDGWQDYSVLFEFENGADYIKRSAKNSYMKAFLADLCLRPSCYNCHSKSLERESDITLADFWGIKGVLPDMDDNKGTSLILVNSEKGGMVFDEIKEDMMYKNVDIDVVSRCNPAVCKSVAYNKNRTKFMKEIFEKDFEKTVKKYNKTKYGKRLLLKVKRLVKSKILKRQN